MVNKRKNLKKAAEGRTSPLFVHEIDDKNNIYIVEQSVFDDPSKLSSDGIECLVLEYVESNTELTYSVKYPETYIILQRAQLESMYLTN